MSTPVGLITGASTGIGGATSIAFTKERARLVVSGRKEAEGKALEIELHGFGAEAEFIVADGRHEKDMSNLVDEAIARFDRLTGSVEKNAAFYASVPLKRGASPAEVVFVASGKAAYITGQIIPVNGGKTAS
jgi:NAD(P)-dependent dehydrogenase (short-subunit alcohol dehydrogenase family)